MFGSNEVREEKGFEYFEIICFGCVQREFVSLF
jgi:hypothetical protein